MEKDIYLDCPGSLSSSRRSTDVSLPSLRLFLPTTPKAIVGPAMARVQLLALLCLAASLSSLGAQATGSDASVGVYELKLGDFSVKVTNFGARLMSVVLPDSKGSFNRLSSSCCRLGVLVIALACPLSLQFSLGFPVPSTG